MNFIETDCVLCESTATSLLSQLRIHIGIWLTVDVFYLYCGMKSMVRVDWFTFIGSLFGAYGCVPWMCASVFVCVFSFVYIILVVVVVAVVVRIYRSCLCKGKLAENIKWPKHDVVALLYCYFISMIEMKTKQKQLSWLSADFQNYFYAFFISLSEIN